MKCRTRAIELGPPRLTLCITQSYGCCASALVVTGAYLLLWLWNSQPALLGLPQSPCSRRRDGRCTSLIMARVSGMPSRSSCPRLLMYSATLDLRHWCNSSEPTRAELRVGCAGISLTASLFCLLSAFVLHLSPLASATAFIDRLLPWVELVLPVRFF